ncbi:MAG: response regulator [Planctomycetes bacterium]|nr:response regulator [Planctomycetota bacterium]
MRKQRILLVDDMAIFREPIAATLRLEGYEVLCADNGMEALDLARAQPPDLMLLDIAMPDLNGLQLLDILRKDTQLWQIPVIMFTALSEREMVEKAVNAGIQGYLLKSQFSLDEMLVQVRKCLGAPAKPISEREALSGQPDSPTSETVSRSERKAAPPRSMDQSAVLKQVNRKLQMTAVPPVLHHVMALAHSSRSTFDEIASAVHQDQALALRVMKVANSSFYATEKPASNIMEAAQRIGLSELQNIIAAILTIEHFECSSPAGLIPQRFWEHSLATALTAQLIAQEIDADPQDTEPLFLAGLLHDIGRMILGSVFPDEYKWVIESSTQRRVDLVVVEKEVFGLSHADVTQAVLTHWKLPHAVTEAASLHELEIDQIKRMARNAQGALVVALANRLAYALTLGDSGNSMLLPLRDHAQALDLKTETVRSIVLKAIEKTHDMVLLYAARGDQQFREPLAAELAKKAEGEVRLTVLAGDAPSDLLNLFFEQLGWLDTVQPRLAVMSVSSDWELAKRFNELQKLEEAVGVKLAVLVVSPSGSVTPSPHVLQGRPSATMKIPCRFEAIVGNVVKLRDALAPEPVSAH